MHDLARWALLPSAVVTTRDSNMYTQYTPASPQTTPPPARLQGTRSKEAIDRYHWQALHRKTGEVESFNDCRQNDWYAASSVCDLRAAQSAQLKQLRPEGCGADLLAQPCDNASNATHDR